MSSEIECHYRPEKPLGSWVTYFTISLVLHFAVLALILIVPSGASNKANALRQQALDISLVALNPDLPAPPSRTPEPVVQKVSATAGKLPTEATAAKKAPEREPIPVKSGLKKEITKKGYVVKTPDSPKPKAAEPPPKPAPETDRVIADAVKRIEEKADTARPQSVQERIEQMKEQVGDLAHNRRERPEGEESSGGQGDSGLQEYSQLNIWQAEVQVEMKRNWAFSSEMAGDTQGLESRLVIKIMPDGQITDVWFEKRSGNSYLDESAYKTVMKSNPLPPLPEDFPKPYYQVVLGFTPSGMK